VPLADGSSKLGRLRRIGTFETGGTQVAVTLGEDASPFGFIRVSNYSILECLSVISNGGIIGGSVGCARFGRGEISRKRAGP
jgi:hypothetical protein